MLLVSDDLSSMTVSTILYHTRYMGKLSMLLCFKQHLRLFPAIIDLLFFIQIVYHLEIEADIH